MRIGRRDSDKIAVSAPESTIRIDTGRLDQVLNLSGEIGLAKNRLNCLRTDSLQGKTDPETMRRSTRPSAISICWSAICRTL